MATTRPELSLRLATLVRLIRVGGCSFLPAPVCRDWRSPGAASHKRLSEPRGQPKPELLGNRVSSALYEWTLDLPARWSDHSAPSANSETKPSATAIRRS